MRADRTPIRSSPRAGTVRAAPLTLINGSEKLTLRFDCKACEMHVVGKLKPAVAKASAPLNFYKARPVA
ncbi:MAG: hypothetical protein CVV17_00850 [Gammaproteobacteria bacterium HGW-Gammaproteobacteria-7]|nr:MAG: hypothetical protein CVV17_00850 [Gammaproteobacteria bacterium HGW-Gammaproteobacteria-7]